MDIIRKVVAGLVAITACLIYVHASHAAAPPQEVPALGYCGIGPIRAEGQGDVYVPANYSVPR